MRKPKPYTAKAKVLELMNEAKKNAAEIEVGAEISTKDGRPLPQNSISMYLTSMGREFFSPGDRFYFRNCQKTGKRFVGYMFEGDGKEKTEFAVPEKLIVGVAEAAVETINPVLSQQVGREVRHDQAPSNTTTIDFDDHRSVPPDYDMEMGKQRNGGL